MSEVSRIDLLKSERNSISSRINLFSTFLDNYDSNEDEDKANQFKFNYVKLIKVFEKFDRLHDELDALDNSDESKNKRFEIEKDYFRVIGAAQKKFKLDQRVEAPAPQGTSSFSNDTSLNSSTMISSKKVKLPQISLPTFKGNLENWLSFKDSFNSLIHERTDLSDTDKLTYLKLSLKDEALNKIKSLPTVSDNYARAWEVLSKAYDGSRLIQSKHISLILNLPKQSSETHRGLESLADQCQQHVQTLSTLGIEFNQEVLVTILEEKLHKTTLNKWEEKLDRNHFPTFDEIIEFLYETAARLSKQEKRSSDSDPPPAKHRKFEQKSKFNAFVTSIKNCPVGCKEDHFLYKCDKFLKMPVHQRIQLVKKHNLCNNCLRDHGKNQCRFGNCKQCNLRHNSLLHISKANNDSKNSKISENRQDDL